MKKILLALVVLFTVASNAFAGNGYCDGRSNGREIEQCYRVNIETQVANVKRKFNEAMASPNLTDQQKERLRQNQIEWGNAVESQCHGDLVCYYDSARWRDQDLAKVVGHY